MTPPNDWLPGYELLGELGRGGMGVVYRARQVALNRVVALKVTSTGAGAGPVELARFRVEAEAVAALQHPHVVQLFDHGEAGGLRYLALEYVPRGTLAARLRGKRLAPREAAALVARLADAVHAAHSKGVLHRDLKPANVLLTEAGEPKVTDFGLARVGESDLTLPGAVMGTPNYMSPEQAAGDVRAVGTRSDVWALGAILYELLTGEPPFRRPATGAVIQAVIHEAPVSPRRLNAKVPRDLETVCLKCLQKDPADRYPSADALAADLTAFLGGYPVAARPVGVVRRTWKWVRRHPLRGGVLAVLFAGGLSLGLVLPRYQPARPPAEGSARAGVWVDRDPDAEALFAVAGQRVRVFRYTGQPVEFWLDVEIDGKAVRGGRWTAGRHSWNPAELEALGPAPLVEGLVIWVRGQRQADGSEEWGLHSNCTKRKTGRTGGAVSNVFGSAGMKSETSDSRSSGNSSVMTLPVWPATPPSPHRPAVKLEDFKFVVPPGGAPRTSESATHTIVNPIPGDRPVCVLELKGAVPAAGGSSKDADVPRFHARVMCQVVDDTPKN